MRRAMQEKSRLSLCICSSASAPRRGVRSQGDGRRFGRPNATALYTSRRFFPHRPDAKSKSDPFFVSPSGAGSWLPGPEPLLDLVRQCLKILSPPQCVQVGVVGDGCRLVQVLEVTTPSVRGIEEDSRWS